MSLAYHTAVVGVITIFLYRETDVILERLTNLFKAIHLVGGRGRIQTQHLGSGIYALTQKTALSKPFINGNFYILT